MRTENRTMENSFMTYVDLYMHTNACLPEQYIEHYKILLSKWFASYDQ